MAFDRYLIAPIDSGLQTDNKPWLIPEDAFDYLQNAYVFRGRVRKRFGSEWMGPTQTATRLRASLFTGGAGIGITTAGGAANGGGANVRTILADAGLPLSVGQIFSIGSQIYTVVNPAAGVQNMLATQGTGTFNIATGDYTITGAPALTVIYFYPALPVMGITQYGILAVNNHPTYVYDTRYAYLFSAGAWERSGVAIWNGTDINYVWSVNWQSIAGTQVLFATNFNATIPAPGATDDPIWYFNGTTWTSLPGTVAGGGIFFRPTGLAVNTGPYVKTARVIVAFKNRLILLNTVENNNPTFNGAGGTNTAYVNRARYCFYGSPLAVNAWYEKNTQDTAGNVAAGGGFVDATTEEQIISAEFIKDRLIVYFERSTWELVYTNNQVLPFVWQKINTELGAQSTFSVIPFDREVLGIGQSGIHACNGSNVVRVDNKIPNTVFEFETRNNATIRTAGIRDYFTELVYWAYVDDLKQLFQKFPNQVLVYNYKNGSWALFDDCITTFGYFEQSSDVTWASSFPLTWEQAGFNWNSNVIQAQQRQILMGTPEGFVTTLNPDLFVNAPSMQITNMAFAATGFVTLTIINHNLTSQMIEFDWDQDFIIINNVVADATTMATLNGAIFNVFTVVDANTITIDTTGRSFAPLVAGTYAGGGTAARVSNIQIRSKQWNPYVDQDKGVYLAKIDFSVTKTATGAITVDYYPSSTEISMISEGVATGSIVGNSVLETFPYDPAIYPLEEWQTLLNHPIYFQTSGSFVQIGMSFDYNQMINPQISRVGFEMQGLTLYTAPTSSRLQ